LVVVLFLDLVGWTQLAQRMDPEPLRSLLEQYYASCSAAVTGYGGSVEKFIGDAVMAVFGAVKAEEDDAIRALHAAVRIRAEVAAMRVPGSVARPQVHCGIAAGEALVTDSALPGPRVVGDVVNLAARLQAVAAAGEILVNQVAADLARPRFEVEAVPPLTLKGHATPVPAARAVGPASGAGPAADRLRMINRDDEQARLASAYHEVARGGQARVVTVLGPPGIGKTRLVTEAVLRLGAGVPAPSVAFGRCQSYLPDQAFDPLAQVLEEVERQVPACARLRHADGHLDTVLRTLSAPARAVPAEARGVAPGVEEISWAARALLTAAATVRPLVIVWDSIESAGQGLLTLIGELLGTVRALPVLMICVARPELAEQGIPWGASPEADVIDVGALASADCAALAVSVAAAVQAGAGDVRRATAYSAGNPLFIRLMIEAAVGPSAARVPPTITAMVGAMLDRLPVAEQRLLGAAAVAGVTFTLGQLARLGEPATAVGITALTRRNLVQATARDGEFRFTQQPVHEVVYARLDKERRLGWHRRLAEEAASPAFHDEAAARLLRELRPEDAELPGLTRRAARALLAEGTVALRQRDLPTAIGLLQRGLKLADGGPASCGPVIAVRLSDALLLSGETERAMAVAAQSADPRCVAQYHLVAVRCGLVRDREVADLRDRLARGAVEGLAWCRFEQLRMLVCLGRGRFGAAEQAAHAALRHARAIGDAYEEDRMLVALCEVRQWSPTSAADQLAGCAQLLRRFADDRFLLMPVLAAQARCLALTGDLPGARSALRDAGAVVDQLRLPMGRVLMDQTAGVVRSLDGEHAAAERHFRAAADALERAGHGPVTLTLRVQAARERAWRELPDAAVPAGAVPAGAGPDAAAEVASLLRRVAEMELRGQILCRGTALRIGLDQDPGELRALLGGTDDPCLLAEAYIDQARACRQRGEHTEAATMASMATALCTAVGATRLAQLARESA
jgi:class 3 adenylate cyclase